MASGRAIYRDFMENHSPLLPQLLARFAVPADASVAALRTYVTTARLMSGVAGTLAAICAAAFAAGIAGRPAAAAGALVPLLLLGWTSLRAFDEIRAEPYTLLLFWLGALLLVIAPDGDARGALMLGAGLGAIGAAAVWNPKWPLESIVMFVWFCRRAFVSKRTAFPAIAAAMALPAAAVLIELRAATLRDLIFFSIRYPAAMARWFATSGLAPNLQPFAFCSPWLQPWLVLPAALVLALLAPSRRIILPLVLLAASLLELRFVYSYPHLWPQYFAMWGCCAAVVCGLLASEVSEKVKDRHGIVAAALAVVFAVHELPLIAKLPDERHWAVKEAIRGLLQPGEAAWVRPEEYPMAVPAGSWYWYSFDDQVPFTIGYAQRPETSGYLPRLRDEDLPPCRLLAQQFGAPPGYVHVRVIDRRAVRNLPKSEQCLRALGQMGVLRRIGGTPLWEVQPPRR